VSDNWLESGDERVLTAPPLHREWWKAFDDPVLDRLIERAYSENLDLRTAAVRVLEARAELGVAVGGFYPQTQRVQGSVQYNRYSESSPFSAFQTSGSTGSGAASAATSPTSGSSTLPAFWESQLGFAASWEPDFWGKFRRAIESADADWLAALANYDSTLVTLTADVAGAYIQIKTLERRLAIARANVDTQRESLKIARARFRYGTASQLDPDQAETALETTRASIPPLEAQLRQAENALCLLLGLPPSHLAEELAGAPEVLKPPPQVAVGIPRDLLRRRPDVRNAEYQAAAQCARIGVAKADLLPALSLNGTLSFVSTDAGTLRLSDMFQWGSRSIQAGPSVQWDILNYGRITNNVRVQDARFQELLIAYQSTVLQAQHDVENALTAFLRAQETATVLARGVAKARRALDLALLQYQGGAVDFTTVVSAQQSLLNVQDNLASSLGDISTNLVSVYRALGGGWEIRTGSDLLPPEISQAMAERTDWGALLSPAVYLPDESDVSETLRLPDW